MGFTEKMQSTDPIAAPATPPGGGIAVLRLSGPGVGARVSTFLATQEGKPLLPPRTLKLCDFLDPDNGHSLDRLLVVFFPAPHSYTGEEMVELHCHGAAVIVARILTLLTGVGIRAARPGEFTERAFLNGKMDLTRAEAVASLVQASSLRAARQAARQTQGSLSRVLAGLRRALVELLAQVEAHLDFPEEELEPWQEEAMLAACRAQKKEVGKMVRAAPLGRQLTEGLELVVAGRPNVGKSSLFNRLCGMERAIVTPHPGTTRDLVESHFVVAGLPVRLLDTAGLRQADCPIEQEGIRRGRERLQQADRILMVLEAHKGFLPEDQAILDTLPGDRTMLVWNKADLLPADAPPPTAPGPACRVSAATGEGCDALVQALGDDLGREQEEEGVVPLVARQTGCLSRLHGCLDEAETLLASGRGLELVARALRDGLHILGELTGQVTPREVLQRIFEQFCIGK